MKTKNLKVVIMLSIILLTIFVFNVNTVQATNTNITEETSEIKKENSVDKEYVENFLESLGFKKSSETGHYVCKEFLYQELDSDIKLKTINKIKENKELSLVECDANGGVDNYFKTNSSVEYEVYKNDMCYAYIEYYCDRQYQLTVPSTLENTDKAYIDYALPKIKAFLSESSVIVNNLKIEKISGYWYKVTGDNQEFLGNIILKKQEGAFLGNNIYANNLPLNANITVTEKENKTMETEIKNKGYSKILGSYELTLKGIDKLESPVDITFNVGTEYNGKSIYVLHQKRNGTYENFEKTVTSGKITITVSELSPFILGVKENENQENNSSTNTPNTDNKNNINKGEKDETPKTGVSNIIGYVIAITVITGAGLVLVKKKMK